ncbi:MAG: sulfatase-like hydrolase/transferase [Gammaproteobacteria bacterium]|nr:sulfatase-like hydrolase/transferase [Gammaproteobacteria bacterium]
MAGEGRTRARDGSGGRGPAAVPAQHPQGAGRPSRGSTTISTRSDKLVGQLLDQLEEDGLADNTIVVHWSDHGEGLPRSKRWLYDGGIRIPCIVRWPGRIEPGTRSEQMVSLVDLAPTMLSLAGAPVPAHLQGQPFLGPDTVEREYIFAGRDRFDEAYDRVRAAWTSGSSTCGTTTRRSRTCSGSRTATATRFSKRCGACTWPAS